MDIEDSIDQTLLVLKQLYSDIINIIWDKNRIYHDSNGDVPKTKPNHNIKSFSKCFTKKRCNDTRRYIASSLQICSPRFAHLEDYGLDSKEEMTICLKLLKTAFEFMDRGEKPNGVSLTGKLTYDAILVYYRMSCLVNSYNLLEKYDFDELIKDPYVNDYALVNVLIKNFTYALYDRFLDTLYILRKDNSNVQTIASSLYEDFIDLIQHPYFKEQLFARVEMVIHNTVAKYPEFGKMPHQALDEMKWKHRDFVRRMEIIHFPNSIDDPLHRDCLGQYFVEKDYSEEIIHWLLIDNALHDDEYFSSLNAACRCFISSYSALPEPKTEKSSNKYDAESSIVSILPKSIIEELVEMDGEINPNLLEEE